MLSTFVLCMLFSLSFGQWGSPSQVLGPQPQQLPPAQQQQNNINWPQQKFTDVEQHLQNIQALVKSMQELVYQERMKHHPYAPNTTAQPIVNPQYSNFVDGADRRLSKMELLLTELKAQVASCDPPGWYFSSHHERARQKAKLILKGNRTDLECKPRYFCYGKCWT